MLFDELRCFYSIHAWHLNIHQYYITGAGTNILQHVLAIGEGAGTAEPFSTIQQKSESFPQMLIIFKNGDSYQMGYLCKVDGKQVYKK